MEGGSSDKIMKREKEGEELGVGKKLTSLTIENTRPINIVTKYADAIPPNLQ